MGPSTQYDREEDALCEAVNDGRITQAEYREQMRELQRDYRAQAEEAAQDAYDREMSNW